MKIFLKIFLIVCLLSSCKAKKITQSESIQHVQKDTIFIEKIQAIHDSIFIKIPVIQTLSQECDTLCQKELTRVLSLLNTKKKNGENQAGIYYDKYQHQLVLFNALEAQFNRYKSHYQEQKSSKNVVIEKPVPYIPKLVKVFAGIGVLSFVLFLSWGFFTLKK